MAYQSEHLAPGLSVHSSRRKPEGGRPTSILLTTMVLGGLWHGANWTFVIWGWLHGLALAAERFLEARLAFLKQIPQWQIVIWLQRIFIFHLVCLGWIFFRS